MASPEDLAMSAKRAKDLAALIERANACSTQPSLDFAAIMIHKAQNLDGFKDFVTKKGKIDSGRDHLEATFNDNPLRCSCRVHPLIKLTAAETMEEFDRCLLGWIVERTIYRLQVNPDAEGKTAYLLTGDNRLYCPFCLVGHTPEREAAYRDIRKLTFHECRLLLIQYLASRKEQPVHEDTAYPTPSVYDREILSLFPKEFEKEHDLFCKDCVDQSKGDHLALRNAFNLTREPGKDPIAEASAMIDSIGMGAADTDPPEEEGGDEKGGGEDMEQ